MVANEKAELAYLVYFFSPVAKVCRNKLILGRTS